MRKIPTLFVLDFSQPKRKLTENITPGCEWVISGEGVATRKWDGTCCLVKDAKLYRRYDAKHGKQPPNGFIPADEPDAKTGHWPGWLLVTDCAADQWHREAFSARDVWPDGTYELCGPKINGNPEGLAKHTLIQHGQDVLPLCPRDFVGLQEYLSRMDIEGFVFWRDLFKPNCEKAKIKKKDFGLARKPPC